MNSFKNNKEIWEQSKIVNPFHNNDGWLDNLLQPEITILNHINTNQY